ncbi:4-alpha-glucanotransferase [Rhodococcoides fascians]|uniref:4-alpha-glucanotransferase n=1 Tax=Rhodococcoides fascians TaxID=1828 RepID=UPI0009B8B0E5|nr:MULTISPECIES: 4-alpha-glucanotransferase [Rhodococcus]OZE96202.1 4-alpha-glucanotransferase [Rhodococcus sp. 15-1189-1-1a]OZF10748.1 4-alpha-glucanotransferase [Rhodococcus sp. 14-2686-1-2]
MTTAVDAGTIENVTYTALLRDLARECGVSTAYRGWDRGEHEVSEDTLRRILAARGISASDEAEVRQAMADVDELPWRRMLPPVVVTVEGDGDVTIAVHVPHGDPVDVHLETEFGERRSLDQLQVWVEPREIDGSLVGRATFEIPADLPLGWHTVVAVSAADGRDPRTASCVVVTTPRRLSPNDALLGRGGSGAGGNDPKSGSGAGKNDPKSGSGAGRNDPETASGAGRNDAGFTQRLGSMTQLYSLRSDRSWGVGDYGDLADLASITGRYHDFDYVLVNPLHAQRPVPPVEASPYLPTTRRFFDPMYIRIEDIPETAYLPKDQYAKVREAARSFARANKRTGRIDRDPSFRAKLKSAKRIFAVPRSAARQAEFDAFCEREGSGLDDFALWCALAEKYGPEHAVWTDKAAHPGTSFSSEFRTTAAEKILFHKWLQWICDQQLARAQRTATAAGMDIGIMHDLAVGVHRQGADAWTLGSALTTGVTVGAPPDNFNQQGQNWNQPPWNPDELEERAYGPYRDMLRTVLRHAGGIRVDHILGLFRLWWIPEESSSAADGAYVEYDHEALIGILVLEAERAGAVVVGEDLGVFEPRVQEYLGSRGLFGTSILWFENDGEAPIPPEEYRELCLTTVTTHDLPPTVGYLRGEHIALRSRLGLLERELDAEIEQDAAGREAVLDLARTRGLLATDASEKETVEALYRLIRRSPSTLLGIALVDLVGENRIQNQPGTDETQYRNWRIPLADHRGKAVWVDDLVDHPRLVSLVQALRE